MKIFIYSLWFLSFHFDFITVYGGSVMKSSCPLFKLKNGISRVRNRGRILRFQCNKGFLRAGDKLSTCVRGVWDPLPPKCVRPTCKPIGHQTNNDALLIYPTHSGAVQYFFCKAGYTLKGPSDVSCDGQKWDNNAPICLPSNTKPKLFCDFETTDLCGYTHDLNHDFDWRRENYKTPSGSIGTGPSFDHTKGVSQDGYYMYIESTSRIENDTARLISPVYEKMDGEICLEFFYHMYGSTMGSLRVYLKKTSETWNLNPRQAVFSESGNQGDRWFRGYERLGKIDEEFQIIFEGVRGSGYVSDIAIDDVKIINNCKDDETLTTTTEDNSSTEMVQIVDSCDRRCGSKEALSNTTYHLTCDCDDDCFVNNRCCPDYYDYCIIQTTEPDDMTTVVDAITNTDVKYYTARETTTTTRKPFTKIITSKPTTSISTKATFKTTTPRISPTRLTKPTRPTIPLFPNFTKPIIHIQPPPTTPEIIRKIVPTSKSPPPATIPKIDYPKNSYEDNNDVEEVPIPTKSDEGLLLPNSGQSEDEGSISKEWSEENYDRLDMPYQRNFSVNDKLLSQFAENDSDVNVSAIVISVAAVVVVVGVVVFVVLRRYRWPRRRMHFSNGESQSDVRFLTNEEILDLSLDGECYGQ